MYKDYAYRTVTASVYNGTNHTLKMRPATPFVHGQWQDETPPGWTDIAPGATRTFTVESSRWLTGCEGSLTFDVLGTAHVWQITWDNPYIGANRYGQLLDGSPFGACTNRDAIDDDLAWVSYNCTLRDEAPFATTVGSTSAPEQSSATVPDGQPVEASAPMRPVCKTAAAGWSPMRAIEAVAGADRYLAQTCMLTPKIAMFFPSMPPATNRVHVAFIADSLSYQLGCHALRASADALGWFLVAVDCNPEGDTATMVTAEMILKEMDAHGFGKVERLRLSCHSRGVVRLGANTAMGNLVSKSPKGRVFDMSIVDRVVAMDSGHAQSSAGAALALFPEATRFGFHVGCANWGLAPARTVNLLNGPMNQELLDTLIAARIIADAPAIGRGAPVDADILDFMTLLALPPIGGIDSRNIDAVYARIAAADPALRARTIALGKGTMCPVNSATLPTRCSRRSSFTRSCETRPPRFRGEP